MRHEDQRPDPDALLAQFKEDTARAQRGKLKVFFGASPGVGKTYAMLAEARRLRYQGVDVVVGVAETHGRAETAAQLQGLEQIPPRRVEYRGRQLQEFDLDTALARRPSILLVDELAHSNAEGSRHPKRWQDVEELLAAGIDVLTTVNVQHIESLNDVVGSITGIRVWETVPDHVFDEANEVILVDLPPDDLLRRLKEGKVYLPEQAERAIQNFFRKGNLMALRELALRRTAERVDDQMQAFRRDTHEQQVWQTGDALLVCIGPGAGEEKLVRTAARLAVKFNAPWHAVYVETPALQQLPDHVRAQTMKSLKLAEELGGQSTTLAAQDAAEALVRYARQHNLGRLVVGRASFSASRWRFSPTLSRRLAAMAPDIDLINVAREPPARGRPSPRNGDQALNPRANWPAYGYTLLSALTINAITAPLVNLLDLANIVMIFLLGVVFVAYFFGRAPSVLMACLSVASFDFFFVPPRLSFAVSDVQYLITFAVMLAVGLLIGQLMSGVRYQLRVSLSREERAKQLFRMAKSLSSALTEEQVAQIAGELVNTSLDARACLLILTLEDTLRQIDNPEQPSVDRAIAQWSYDHAEAAGLGTDTLPAASQLYLPLRAPMRTRGVLVVEPRVPQLLQIPEQRRLLDTYAALISIALERVHFVTVAQDSLVRMESERLRNTLLAALSHDLRTPLTALVGLSENLEQAMLLEKSSHIDNVRAIAEQAKRTCRLMNNLLDMAKLQTDGLTLNKDWQSIDELVGSAITGLEPTIQEFQLQLELPPDLPLVRCDAMLVGRVLFNLLENVTKYCPLDTVMGVSAVARDKFMEIEVWDRGPGLPCNTQQSLFEKFVRGEREDATPGVGLGLAICQSIVQAHGGKIWAHNRGDGGASFHFTLPLEPAPSLPKEALRD